MGEFKRMKHSYWDLKHEKHQWIWDYGWFQTIWRALIFCYFKAWGEALLLWCLWNHQPVSTKEVLLNPSMAGCFGLWLFRQEKIQLSNLQICLGVLEISENQRQRDFQRFFVSRIFQIYLGLTYLQQLYIYIDPNIWVCQKVANFETHLSTMQKNLKAMPPITKGALNEWIIMCFVSAHAHVAQDSVEEWNVVPAEAIGILLSTII